MATRLYPFPVLDLSKVKLTSPLLGIPIKLQSFVAKGSVIEVGAVLLALIAYPFPVSKLVVGSTVTKLSLDS